METLSCIGVTKKYENKEVLKNINLSLEKGKVYGLIGRNGAGKTTLLSVMSAQNPATAGMIKLGEENIWENPKALGRICFSREIHPNDNGTGIGSMKAKEYLRVASCYYPDWDQELAEKLVKEFELDTRKKMTKLSKGMLSMVTIIVALASKAEFTFLDEPVAGLDVVMREHFYRMLLEEYTNSGRTFIISTHIIEEAADVFEEVLVIKKGELLLKENTETLLSCAYHISGLAEVVDAAVKGLACYQARTNGRAKSVTVLLKKGERLPEGYDVSIQPLSLQNVFVALCGMEP